MDPDKIKRRQSLKVIFSEAIMVITVIITVTILGFLVSGYWINSNFEIERQGLLQISSIPTGADVYIDGDGLSWLQRTNTSKVLSSGEHTVLLTKDGYDSWSKTINISEGLLYRLHYPRLFLKERIKENIFNTSEFTTATLSPDHNYLLLTNNTTEWTLINLEEEKLNKSEINISNLLTNDNTNEKMLFTGNILANNWDSDSNHILFKLELNDNIEWILIDTKDPKNNLNLTKEFDVNFNEIKIIDDNSNNLLAIRNGNLYKINVPNKTLSDILIENINDFNYYNNEIIFSATTTSEESSEHYLGLMKLSNNKIIKLSEISPTAKITLSKFYDDEYITILDNNIISLYKKDDFTKIADFELSFIPNSIKVGHNGEFIIANSGQNIATLDMEPMEVTEWTIEGENFGWIDNDMIFTVHDGELIVYDYDGLNRRVIANNISSHFPAAITNDKWLYYFSDDNLVREWLIK